MNAKGPDPNATQRMLLEGQLTSAQSSAGDSLARLAFERCLGELNERAAALEALHEQIARARARGYVWSGDLEARLAEARQRSRGALDAARAESVRAAQQLRPRVDAVARDARRLVGQDPLRVRAQIEAVSREASAVDSALDAADSRIAELAADFTRAVDTLTERLRRIHFTLDQFAQGSFQLQPEENPLAAIEATWEDSPQGKRAGVLLFTAHRLRFEALEEVVLERTLLFFASRTETRRTLLMDAPVGYLAASEDSERGLLMKDQLVVLTFRMATGGFAKCTFEVEGNTAKEVDNLLEQLRTGDLERQRFRGAMPVASTVGVPVRWPEQCAQCGARMEPPVRGQTYLTCGYCNTKHDVVLGEG